MLFTEFEILFSDINIIIERIKDTFYIFKNEKKDTSYIFESEKVEELSVSDLTEFKVNSYSELLELMDYKEEVVREFVIGFIIKRVLLNE